MILLPLALVAISLFFIPNIPKGVDLKGGTLISIQASGSVDVAALKASLLKYSDNVDVRTVSSPVGTGLEIELESSPMLSQAEEKLSGLLSLDRELSDAEIELGAELAKNVTLQAQQDRVNALRQRVSAEAGVFYTIIQTPLPAGDAHALAKTAQQDFADARQKQSDDILAAIQTLVKVDSYSFKQIGSSLSKFFVTKTQQVVLLSFLLCAIIVFIVFRSLVPSIAVLSGAISDVCITAGAMGLLGIPLSLATVATLLMLIGFSLDTDIMLTIRVFKRKEGKASDRAYDAMKTGFLMNLTTMGAFGALLLIAYWLQIPTYSEIGAVAVIGAFADFFATWFLNAPVILMATQRKDAAKAQVQ